MLRIATACVAIGALAFVVVQAQQRGDAALDTRSDSNPSAVEEAEGFDGPAPVTTTPMSGEMHPQGPLNVTLDAEGRRVTLTQDQIQSFGMSSSKFATIDLSPPEAVQQPEPSVFFSSSKRLDVTTIPERQQDPKREPESSDPELMKDFFLRSSKSGPIDLSPIEPQPKPASKPDDTDS